MKFYVKNIIGAAAVLSAFTLTACVGDLDVDNVNPQKIDANEATTNTDGMFAKIYANMVLTGQKGPDGQSDLDDIDEGTSNMIRQIWNANELTTDEAACIWGDAGIPEFNHNTWNDEHPMMRALYYRLNFGVTLCNNFLEVATASDAETLARRAEVRFMRALYYYYLMDLYGNVPFKTTVAGAAQQVDRTTLSAFLESELKAIGDGTTGEVMKDPKTNTYGRADKAAAWLLLARLYLNSQVYTGVAKWTEARTYADKVLGSAYKLCTTPAYGYTPFQLLFMGDNDTNGAQDEVLLPALHDGELTQTWGGCLFIIASTTNGDITASYPTGTSEVWGGNRARRQFVDKFVKDYDAVAGIADATVFAQTVKDDRALFVSEGRTPNITDEGDFKSGYAYVKFLAKHADGSDVHHMQFVDTDFPMLRRAEANLIYAEADARLNGGNCTAAGLAKIQELRNRAEAYSGMSSFSLDEIEEEWSREFAYEGMRRMTLVRFNKYGGQHNYSWEWMNGIKANGSFEGYRNVFPLPSSAVMADNLKQNPGY